ncbi:MAG: type II secretion system secretin GspD [Myxococcales bacterium]
MTSAGLRHQRLSGRSCLLLVATFVLPALLAASHMARGETLVAQAQPAPGAPAPRILGMPTRLPGASLPGGIKADSSKAKAASTARRTGPGSRNSAVPPGAVTATLGGTAATGTAVGADGKTAAGVADSAADREFNSCHKFPANKRIVKLNMKPETELGDLISWISSITCKQFLLPGTIPANSKKVTVIAPQLITPEEAYRLFLAALDSVGLTVQESGKFYRIIETVKARGNAPLYGPDGEILPGDRYITRLVRVEHGDTNEMSQVLTRLKSEQGDIIAYPPQGALIITDVSSSVDRMMKVLEELDQPAQGEKVWIIRMKNTAAGEMAQKLAEIFKVEQLGGRRGAAAAPAAGTPNANKARGTADLAMEMTISKMIPDERSNQLIIVASDRAYARLLTLIRKLDVPIEGGDGRIHVYYCENANCDELGQTLSAITGVSVTGGGQARGRRGGTGAAAPAPAAAAPGSAGGQLPLLFDGDMRVSFDRPTNALIILSSLKDYQVLRRVIEKLDSPRKQVFVEAMVMEVALDKTRTLGASFHGAVPAVPLFGKTGLLLGGLDASKTLFPASILQGGGDTLLGLAAGIIGPPVPGSGSTLGSTTTAGTDIPAFGVLVRALQQNNDVNVLSTPHLLIMNNEDGEISVGQNLPFQGASFGGGAAAGGLLGGLGGFATPVQRTDVALKMKLTPHVNEHDMIRLEVDQEIQDILSPNFNGLGPATSKRSAKTTVVARDQQTIVIGGLMSDRNVERVTKIPFLGDIPILGFFFRNTTRTIQKTNILIALTPYVITDQSDLRRVLEKKLKERREFVDRFGTQDVVNPEASIDYRRKRGMLEEINRTARDIEIEEREMQDQLEHDAQEEAGPVDVLPPGPPRSPATDITPSSSPPPSPSPAGAGNASPPAGALAPRAGAPVPARPMAPTPPPPPFSTPSPPTPGDNSPAPLAPPTPLLP